MPTGHRVGRGVFGLTLCLLLSRPACGQNYNYGQNQGQGVAPGQSFSQPNGYNPTPPAAGYTTQPTTGYTTTPTTGYTTPPQPTTPSEYSLPAPAAQFSWPASTGTDLIVTTAPEIQGFKVTSYRGLVEGVAVREPTWDQNLAAGFQGMFGGGSIAAYGQMCEQGRIQAYNNLMRRARGMGANAVISVRFDSEPIRVSNNQSATAVVCYGTAVVIAPESRQSGAGRPVR